MSNLSGIIQNGQTLTLKSGTGAINAGDLVQIGGPGNEAWSVVTADNAALATQQIITPVTIEAGTVNNYARWGIEIDTLGNVYTATPNASSQGIAITKYSPSGTLLLGPTVVDVTAHAMISIRLLPLSNGTFATVYIDSTTGGVRFVLFDTNLNIIAGPTAVATGYFTGAVSYADACALSGGGFAVVYQNSTHNAIDLQTYTNAGSVNLIATSVQAVTGTALVYLRLGQLHSGNLVVAMRTTSAPAGTSFVVVTVGGASVQTNVIVDSTSTAGFLNLSILATGGFAVSCLDGTNAVAAVYTDAGVIAGSAYTAADTLNSTTYIQSKMTNDGLNFYFAYVQSAGGLAVVQLTPAGASAITSTGILSSTFTSTSSIDGSISNNILMVLQAGTTTGGQHYVAIGLPDSSLGVSYPSVMSGPTVVGSAAGTTGAYWPTIRAVGDFTALTVYDHQTTAATLFGIIKFASSAIQGVAQNSIAAGNPGTNVTVNPGIGSYPINAILGTSPTDFDHSLLSPAGNRGAIFTAGVALSNPAISPTAPLNGIGTQFLAVVGASSSYPYTAPVNVMLNLTTIGSGGEAHLNGGGIPGGTTSFFVGAGQTVTITTGADTVIASAQRVN